MPLGYRGNANWRDMSEYAVHFAKDSSEQTAYWVMLSILWEQHIRPGGPFGAVRKLAALGDSQQSSCFSEIPLDMLERLINRRKSLYGIGFTQERLIQDGGARVWYLDKGSAAAATFQRLIGQALQGRIDPKDDFWRLTPLVDFPGEYPGTQFRFEWEREWRVPGGLRFTSDDVAFLFIPEHEHSDARTFFDQHEEENTGPGYHCPFIDPTWDLPRIQAALQPIPTPGTP